MTDLEEEIKTLKAENRLLQVALLKMVNHAKKIEFENRGLKAHIQKSKERNAHGRSHTEKEKEEKEKEEKTQEVK